MRIAALIVTAITDVENAKLTAPLAPSQVAVQAAPPSETWLACTSQ